MTKTKNPKASEATLLDVFAGQAMQSITQVVGNEARSWFAEKLPGNMDEIIAINAYKIAQAMLSEREKYL